MAVLSSHSQFYLAHSPASSLENQQMIISDINQSFTTRFVMNYAIPPGPPVNDMILIGGCLISILMSFIIH